MARGHATWPCPLVGGSGHLPGTRRAPASAESTSRLPADGTGPGAGGDAGLSGGARALSCWLGTCPPPPAWTNHFICLCPTQRPPWPAPLEDQPGDSGGIRPGVRAFGVGRLACPRHRWDQDRPPAADSGFFPDGIRGAHLSHEDRDTSCLLLSPSSSPGRRLTPVLTPSRAILQEVLDADLSSSAFPFSTHQLVRAAGHLVGTSPPPTSGLRQWPVVRGQSWG